MDRQTDRQKDGWEDGQMEGWMDGRLSIPPVSFRAAAQKQYVDEKEKEEHSRI